MLTVGWRVFRRELVGVVRSSRRVSSVPHYIDGKEVASKCENFTEVTNPATGEILHRVPCATDEEVDGAVRAAFDAAQDWKRTPQAQRSRILFRLREEVAGSIEEIASIITRELGKVPVDARGDVLRGLEVLEYSCGVAANLSGPTYLNMSVGLDAIQIREPIGVCLGITPFNFPAMIPLWIFPMALACGNPIIMKPSEIAPSAMMKLASLATTAGVPRGVLNVVHGGRETVTRLLSKQEIKAVSFVGSTSAGTEIYKTATSLGIRAQCNLGAKNHGIVLPDCNRDLTIRSIVGAAFGASGQRCMALSTIVLVGDARNLLSALREEAMNLRLGTSADSDVGPLVTRAARKRVELMIEKGIEEGASLILDGRGMKPSNSISGNWIGPTIFSKVHQTMSIYQEEIFGPVLIAIEVDTFKEAIDLVNRNPYANGTCLFTSSAISAQHFQQAIDVGQVGVNVPIPLGSPGFGFTGSRGSFLGDLPFYGPFSPVFYTKAKSILTRWQSNPTLEVNTSIPT